MAVEFVHRAQRIVVAVHNNEIVQIVAQRLFERLQEILHIGVLHGVVVLVQDLLFGNL